MRDLIRDLSAQGMTVLLSSHLLGEVEELCNRVAIVRQGGVAYQGSLAELRRQAGGGYLLRTSDDERRPPGRRRAAGDRRTSRPAPRAASPSTPSDEAAVGALSLALTESGALIARAEPAPRDARGPLLQADRGRAPAPGGERRARPLAERGVNPGTLTVYRWELRKLRAQKRTYLGLGAAALVPIIFVVALVIRGDSPNDVAFGRYVHDTGLAIPLVLLLFGVGLDVPADHRAGRRRHRRRRGSQRDPEDDPHPLGRAPAGLRRQGARDLHLRDRWRSP